jgi:hypothetical protein
MTIKENILKSSYSFDKELHQYEILIKDNIFYENENLDELYDIFVLGEQILTETIFTSNKVKNNVKNTKKMSKGKALININKLSDLVRNLVSDAERRPNSRELGSMIKGEIKDLTDIIYQLIKNQDEYDKSDNSKQETQTFIKLKKQLIKNFAVTYKRAGKIVYPVSKFGKIMKIAKAIILTAALTTGVENATRFVNYEPDIQQGIEKIMGEKPGTRVYTEPVTGQKHVKGEHEKKLDKEVASMRERGNSAATAVQNATTDQLNRPGGSLDTAEKKLSNNIEQGQVSSEIAKYVNSLQRNIGRWSSRQPTILNRLEQALAGKIDSAYFKNQQIVYRDIDAAAQDIQLIKSEIDKIIAEVEKGNLEADQDAITELNDVRSDIVKSLSQLREVKNKYFDSQGHFAKQADESSDAAAQHYQQKIAAARDADERQSNNFQFFVFRILQRIFKSIPEPQSIRNVIKWLSDTVVGNYSVETDKTNKKRYLNY